MRFIILQFPVFRKITTVLGAPSVQMDTWVILEEGLLVKHLHHSLLRVPYFGLSVGGTHHERVDGLRFGEWRRWRVQILNPKLLSSKELLLAVFCSITPRTIYKENIHFFLNESLKDLHPPVFGSWTLAIKT